MRTNNWAIQLSRSIYDSDIWYKPSDWLKIWIYILWNVNYWDTHKFNRWENYFKYEIIALECNTSYKIVVNCIKFLKEGKQIETQKTTRGNIIKVLNYDKYQDLSNYGKADSKAKREADSKASGNTIKEERKERKEIKNTNIIKATKVAPLTLKELITENIDIDLFIKKYNTDEKYVREQLNKFYYHRIEKKPNWRKEKWEMEKTYDVNLRFIKRLDNNEKWNKNNFNINKDIWITRM